MSGAQLLVAAGGIVVIAAIQWWFFGARRAPHPSRPDLRARGGEARS